MNDEEDLQKEIDSLMVQYGISKLFRSFIFTVAKRMDDCVVSVPSYFERYNSIYQTLLLAQRLFNSRFGEVDPEMHKATLNTERYRIEKFEKENLKKLSSLEKFGE